MSMKLTTALASRYSLPSYSIGTSSSEHGCPSPSQPALHMGQPLERIPNRETLSVSILSTNQAMLWGICCHRGKGYRKKFIMSLQGVLKTEQVIKLP